MKIICISGKGQHGKDTTATYLQGMLEAYNDKVLIIHYADILKHICKDFFQWNGEKDECGRGLLQTVGTDMIREKDPNYFVEYVARLLKIFEKEWDYVLIPDTRFPNEIDYLRDSGFNVTHIRVVRENFVSPLTEKQRNHISETALDNVQPDLYINNCGSLADLYRTCQDIIITLIGFYQMTFDDLERGWFLRL